jgi:hypothetical protein
MGRTYRGSCPRVANLPDGHRTHWVQRTCRCNRHQRVIRPAAKQLSLSARGTRRGANLRPAFRSAAEGSACGRELAFALRLRVAAKWASGRRIEMSKRQQLIYDFKKARKGPRDPSTSEASARGKLWRAVLGPINAGGRLPTHHSHLLIAPPLRAPEYSTARCSDLVRDIQSCSWHQRASSDRTSSLCLSTRRSVRPRSPRDQ